jgi:hypothetical protein
LNKVSLSIETDSGGEFDVTSGSLLLRRESFEESAGRAQKVNAGPTLSKAPAALGER